MKKSSTKNIVAIVVAIIGCVGLITAAVITGILPPIIDLAKTSSLVVRVANNEGASIPGAKVILISSRGSVSDYTDSNGNITFESSKGNKRLIVETDNYQIAERVIRSSDKTANIRLNEKMANSADVIVRTVKESDNSPIAGIEISLVAEGDIFKESSDSDGFARFTLPFPDGKGLNVRISISAKDYEVKDQIITLSPGKLQYIVLEPTALKVEIPYFPTPNTSEQRVDSDNLPETNSLDVESLIGSGVSIEQGTGNGLRVEMLGPNGEPWENVYIAVKKQLPDATGNPSMGGDIKGGHINKQGQINFDIAEGDYVVCSSENPGYYWTQRECVYNITVTSDNVTIVRHQVGALELSLSYANGLPVENGNYEICTEKKDVSGNPVIDRCQGYRTDNTGANTVWRTPGLYIVKLDLRGYNWGNLVSAKGSIDNEVRKGITTHINVQLGQLVIGLTTPDGKPNISANLELFTQKTAVNGSPTIADRVWNGRTDNGGYATIDLTQGKYALKIGETILFNIPVEWGKITQTDGTDFKIK